MIFLRLDKFLWEIGSRSEIKKLLKTGVVTVDGKIIKDGGFQVKDTSRVCYMGEEVFYREFIYIIMNKPQTTVSATFDKKLPVVTDLLPEEYKKFEPFPVGRLDIDTEGLLILTNDGKLAHEITSPRKQVYKKYFAVTDIPMEQSDAKLFETGINLGDFTTLPGKLEFTDNPNEVFVTICEGKFHQVKRMCEKCGKTVTYLKRISIGNLKLTPNLEPGDMYETDKSKLLELIFNQSV